MKVTINKGWYWSAGTKYGWKKDGFDIKGVGIEKSILQSNEEIVVEVNNIEYTLNCKRARGFVNKYRSAQTMPGGTIIGIVSYDIFEEQYHGQMEQKQIFDTEVAEESSHQ